MTIDARTSAIFPFSNGKISNFFCQKNQNCQFKLKFTTKTNPNMQNAMVKFTFSVLDRKSPFWANLVQKFKIISLS